MADTHRPEVLTRRAFARPRHRPIARPRLPRGAQAVRKLGIGLVLIGMLGLIAPPANASGTDRPIKIVLVGDSYSAGNGARDAAGNRNYLDDCRRSPTNWASQYVATLAANGFDPTYVNRACTGATLAGEIIPTQIPQIGADTDLVLMTGGGNDVGFADIVKQCFVPVFRDVVDCRDRITSAQNDVASGAIENQLVTALRNIQGQAPDTKVVVVGYPHLTNDINYQLVKKQTRPCLNPPTFLCTKEVDRIAAGNLIRALALDGEQSQINAVAIANAASLTGAPYVTFVGIKGHFDGPPEHYPDPRTGPGNPDRWVRELETRMTVEWWHYNPDGHREVASVVSGGLDYNAAPPKSDAGASSDIDLTFVVDTTGSMRDNIDAVRASLAEIVATLDASSSTYRVGLVTYRDHPEHTGNSSDYPARLDLPFTSDLGEIQAAIDSLTVDGGGDFPETVLSGLMTAIGKDWRPGVKKIAIAFGDARAHNPEPVTGFTSADVIAASLAVDPVAVYSVSVGSGLQIQEVTEGTAGGVVTASSPADVANQFLSVIADVAAAPFAWMGEAYTTRIGLPTTFTGIGSYDPDGEILSYEWDVNGDGVYDAMTTDPYYTHTYTADFDGLVALRVTDDSARTALATATMSVSVDGDAVPAGIDNCPTDHNPGQLDDDGDGIGDLCDPDFPATFDAALESAEVSATTGEAPTVGLIVPASVTAGAAATVTVTIADPDSTVVNVVTGIAEGCSITGETTLAPVITCAAPGTYAVETYATDESGNIGFGEATVTVAAAPVATPTPQPPAPVTPTAIPDPPEVPDVAPLTAGFSAGDPYVCGGGFFGTVDGGTPPYAASYTITSAAGQIVLGSFPIPAAGAFTSPAGFVDYTTVPDGNYDVTVSFADSSLPQRTAGVSFPAQITDLCGAQPTPIPISVFVPSNGPIVTAAPVSKFVPTPKVATVKAPVADETPRELALTGYESWAAHWAVWAIAAGALLTGSPWVTRSDRRRRTL